MEAVVKKPVKRVSKKKALEAAEAAKPTHNREMLMLVDAISREKSVEADIVYGAVEAVKM